MLAVWDMPKKKQSLNVKLEGPADAVAISPDGAHIAVGFINGKFSAFTYEDFRVLKQNSHRKGKAIQVIKYSGDSRLCAVGAHDSQIITYDVTQNYKPLKRIKSHHSTVTHLDFSMDSSALMSNCTSYEILFHDTSTGKQVTSGASNYKNEPWQTWSCTLGWPVQGIFPPCADGSDINACERSPDGTVLATGDDFRMVKLFKYPCPVDEAAYQKYTGHSEHITNVGFSRNAQGQKYLISTGGEDKAIFQWKYFMDAEAAQEAEADEEDVPDYDEGAGEVGEAEEEDDGFDDGGGFGGGGAAAGDEFAEVDLGAGDQRGCMDVWRGQVEASKPDNFQFKRIMGKAPDNNLTLKWAHGFRSFDTRGNLKYAADGSVVFTTAGVGVVQKDGVQEFFNLHHEDIVAMAMHPNGDIVATGQMAGKELKGPASNTRGGG